jgi:hypothetical protein
MQIRRVVHKRLRKRSDGINLAGDLNAAIAGSVNEPGSHTYVRSTSRNRIVQRNGETEVTSDHHVSDQPLEVDE